MSNQTPNPMKTREDIIEEAIQETLDKFNRQDRIYQSEIVEMAKEYAKQLPQPVSSPSNLIVEVDGEEKGQFSSMGNGAVNVSTNPRFPDARMLFEFENHHVRLLTPQREVVLIISLEKRE